MASFREQGPTERFEKRKLYRFPVQLPARLGRAEDMSSICTNLSTNGASIETAQTLGVGERLAIMVIIAPHEEPLRMVGQVIWKRNIPAIDIELKQICEVGVRFLRPLPSLERTKDEIPEILPTPPDDIEEEEDDFILPRR